MKWFLVSCAVVLLSTQCNSRSILDMESELSVIAASTMDPKNMYQQYPANIFLGAPSSMPMLEVTTGVYERIAHNIAEKLTTPIYRWFGIKSDKSPYVDDPAIDILTRRREPLSTEINIYNNDNKKITNRRSFTIPPLGTLKQFSTKAPKVRKNYLNDTALLRLIKEEDAASGINQEKENNTKNENTMVENNKTPAKDKNNLILKFIEEIKNKYKEVTSQKSPIDNNDYNSIIKNPVLDVYYNKLKEIDDDSNDKDKKHENSNSIDAESKNVENYLNNGGEVNHQEDASINVENNKESVEKMLKYLINIKPSESSVTSILNVTNVDSNISNVTNSIIANNFNEVPFNLSTVFDIPSTLTTRFLKIRVQNDDEFDELAPDEGKEITFISILELIGSAFQVAFGAIASIFGKRKPQS